MARRQQQPLPGLISLAPPLHGLDAVMTIARVVARVLERCTTVVWLGSSSPESPLGALVDVISIAAGRSDVEKLATDVIPIAEDTGVAGIVLLSIDDEGLEVREADLRCWHRLRATYEEAGLLLYDWFVVSEGAARSLGTTAGSPVPW